MSNNIRNLKDQTGTYHQGSTVTGTQVHDSEGNSLLRSILIEMRKMNIHLEHISGVNVEDYNVGEIE